MALRNLPLKSFTAVAPNTEATCDLELGRSYGVLWLEIGEANGTTLASGNLIGDVKFLVNGKEQRIATGVQLDQMNTSNGGDFAAKSSGNPGTAGYRTYLPIYFDEPWRKGAGASSASRFYANGMETVQIKVKFLNVATPVISGWYEGEPSTQTLGAMVKYLRNTYNAVGSVVDIGNLEKRDLYQAMYFFPTTDGKYVSNMKFIKDGDLYRDQMTNLRNQATLLARGMNPDVSATPRYDLIFDYTDPILDWLQGAGSRDLSFRADLSAASAGNMDVISIRTGGLE